MTNQIPLRENVEKSGELKVYFFWKSLEQCDQKYLEPYVHRCLEELEEKWNITHNQAMADYVQTIKSQQGNVSIDPLVPVILGDKRNLRVKEILDFLESDLFMMQNRNPLKDGAFIDLCVILGDQGRAEKCAERFGLKNHTLLDSLKNNEEGALLYQDIMTDYATRFHVNDKNSMSDSGHLTTIIHYIMEHINDKTLPSKISGLWWLQYYWDAICLGTIMLPGNPIVDSWKSMIGSMFSSSKRKISWINATRHAINLKNESNGATKVNYDYLDQFVAYRFLKIEIAKLHTLQREKEDLAYLSEIQFQASVLQKLVVRFIVSPEPCLAEIVASDAMEFIKKTVLNNWTDYFPQVSRLIYEPAIQIVAYFSAALKHLRPESLGFYSRTRYNFTTDTDIRSGIMPVVVSHWLKLPMGKEIWIDGSNGKNARLLSTLYSSLLHHLHVIDDRTTTSEERYHRQTGILALCLISIIASGEMTNENMTKKVITACDCSNIKEHQIMTAFRDAVTINFNPDPKTWKIPPDDEESIPHDVLIENNLQEDALPHKNEESEEDKVITTAPMDSTSDVTKNDSEVPEEHSDAKHEEEEPHCEPSAGLSETEETGFTSAVEEPIEHYDEVESTQSEPQMRNASHQADDGASSMGSTQGSVSGVAEETTEKDDSRLTNIGGEFDTKDPNWSLVPKQNPNSSTDQANVETEEEQSENIVKDESAKSPSLPSPHNELDKLVETGLQGKRATEGLSDQNVASNAAMPNPNIACDRSIPPCAKMLFESGNATKDEIRFQSGGFDDSMASPPARPQEHRDSYDPNSSRSGSYDGRTRRLSGGYGSSSFSQFVPHERRGGMGQSQIYNQSRGHRPYPGSSQPHNGSYSGYNRQPHNQDGPGRSTRGGGGGRPESHGRGGPYRGSYGGGSRGRTPYS